MNIFPNPTNDFITIKLPKSLACKSIQILNSVGELVLQEESTNTESFTVDCSTLPAGIYTLQATTNHGLLVKQVQIQ
jgi:hypothetical protein